MRRFIFFIVAGLSVTLWIAARTLAGPGGGGHTGGGGGHVGGGGGGARMPAVGGGSFSRTAPSFAPQQASGGGNFRTQLTPNRTYVAPRTSYGGTNLPSKAEANYPRTSVPTFAEPARIARPNASRPSPVETRPDLSAGDRGFIRLPGEAGERAASVRPPTVASQRGGTARPGTEGNPALRRGIATAAVAGITAGTMPAIDHYLQQHGQNLQTWNGGRDQHFNQVRQQDAPRLARFQQDREAMWSQLRARDGDRLRMARERGGDWSSYRQDLWRFRGDRAAEIRDRVRNGSDGLFTRDWWHHRRGMDLALGDYSPWWWWNSSPWTDIASFGGFAWNAPIYYDYDANVVAGDDVYIDGQDAGSNASYAQGAIQLANPMVAVDEPIPPQAAGQPDEWEPFGVFALTQQEKGDAIMFFELAMNKAGLISGAFTNVLTGDSLAVSGAVDRATQRAAWHVGDKTNTVYEAGVANLTQEVTPILIHFDTQSTQTWLLVHLASPDLPTKPTSAMVSPQP